MRAPCPAHLIILDLITPVTFDEAYKLCSSSLCSLLQPPVISSLLVPNIQLGSLCSDTLNLCSSFSVRGQVSHRYKTRGKIIVLFILMFKLVKRRREDKRFWSVFWSYSWNSATFVMNFLLECIRVKWHGPVLWRHGSFEFNDLKVKQIGCSSVSWIPQ
jgi:hypothetical protein